MKLLQLTSKIISSGVTCAWLIHRLWSQNISKNLGLFFKLVFVDPKLFTHYHLPFFFGGNKNFFIGTYM